MNITSISIVTTAAERRRHQHLLQLHDQEPDYDQIVALLRRNLIDVELVDDLLGNSTRQLWEKVEPLIREARVRPDDPRLYEHFEFLYHEMARREKSATRVP